MEKAKNARLPSPWSSLAQPEISAPDTVLRQMSSQFTCSDVVLIALKAVQDVEKKITPTKINYKDLFSSFSR
jgi:hypothetical protein